MHMADQRQIQKRKNRIRSIINFTQGIAITLFLFAITIAMYLTVIYRAHLAPLISYAIVFDAGSSHTEMFVYNWPADKSEGLGTTSSVSQHFVCGLASMNASDPMRPNEFIKLKAISDFENHLHLLYDYFAPCLNEAVIKIPSNRHKFSPIFLGATAGMRLASLRNATRANQIFETIREIFLNYPFQFVTARQIRTLTGMEEAIDSWITTNLLLEKFKHRHEKKKRMKQVNSSEELDPYMVGVLDLGGASTQITFTYKHNISDEPVPAEYITNITLFNTVYSPYAHSYLCWGKSEAFRRYRARLLNSALNIDPKNISSSTPFLIHDPCFPRGLNDSTTPASLFRSPCTANEKQLFNYTFNMSISFIGIGNAYECRQHLKNLFDSKRNDKTVNCSYKQEYCTFDHTFQPKLPNTIRFIGVSGYYYVFDNLVFGMPKPPTANSERHRIRDYSPSVIQKRLINVCETEYEILYKQESMNSNNVQHKRALCFDASYVWLLLTYGIGFTKDDLKRVSFAKSFPTGKVGWTLGYMINQTNYIPAEYREKRIEKNRFISGITISLIISLITLSFLIITCYKYICHTYHKRTNHIIKENKDGYIQPHQQSMV
ncbi:unnamed protein product [Rotaria sp. Silwood1]|nr:unnamed protein product [Rotaria sp. Silwood1]CAF3776355.1 unnamed protein product [Rotaria sp. Silwood1]CAF4972128.1 unnamed protein product [Rotaria sp. Silwood1]